MKKYLTEQPEKDKHLTFRVDGVNTYTGTFDGINFKDEHNSVPAHPTNNSYSTLRYDIEWEYT